MQQPRDPPLRFEDRAAFYAWAEQQPGKWEREDGLVVQAMAPERVDHSRVKGNVFVALRAAIRSAGLPCEAFVDGPVVNITAGTDYIPDVVVTCGERNGGAGQSVRNPVIVVEVLSPSTGARDTAVKVGAYFGVPSIQHYMIVSPDHQLVLQHSRLDDDRLLTRVHRGTAGIDFQPPGLHVSVEEFYVGTDLSQRD